MTLVSTPAGAAITAVIRVWWPPDGSGADLEIAGPGHHLLPYDRLEAVDDQGSRYSVRFDGAGANASWQGIVSLSPAPSPGASWLDLIADGTRRLIRLDLTARIPASAAGAIAADSTTPGQLAALCQRLGVSGHGIAAAPAAQLPGTWASVLAQGLSMAAGESFLHVFGSGLPRVENIYGLETGFSWWLRDGDGHWHVAVPAGTGTLEAGEAAFSLRLTPPLAAPPDTLEVVVTGRSARLRAIVPVRP